MHNRKICHRPLVSAVYKWPRKPLTYNDLYFFRDLTGRVPCEVVVGEWAPQLGGEPSRPGTGSAPAPLKGWKPCENGPEKSGQLLVLHFGNIWGQFIYLDKWQGWTNSAFNRNTLLFKSVSILPNPTLYSFRKIIEFLKTCLVKLKICIATQL